VPLLLLLITLLAACGGSARAPERCRNLVQPAWQLPPFARPDNGAFVVEGHAEGAISQWIQKSEDLAGLSVLVVGYGRVETTQPPEPTDEDITPKLWEGAVTLVNGYRRRWGGMESPYEPLRFTGREIASGAWKRFVSPAVAASRAKSFYPHFAFWGVKMAPGVRLRVAALSAVPAPEKPGEPESWIACPNLPAPQPVLESPTRRQFDQDLEPDGAFEDAFTLREEVSGELVLGARYRQGPHVADRFLVSVTDDGSDPRLSPTSRVQVIPAQRGAASWNATVRVRSTARPIRIAVAAAVRTTAGLRAQQPLFPAAWQKP
jgi:hypothetical protein